MAIEQIIEEHGDYLLKVAYLYVKIRQRRRTSCRMCSSPFIKSEGQFRQEASLRTYLLKMTVNRSHDYLRSWKSKRLTLFEKITGAHNSYDT